jgi:hypothetical protein
LVFFEADKYFNKMKILKITTLIAVLALGFKAQADGLYDITFTDGGANVGSGQIDVEGGFAVSGYFDVTAGIAAGSYNLYTAAGNATYPSILTAPSGQFVYDNAVYLTSNPQYPVTNPFEDNNGLLFTDGSNNEVNLWALNDNGSANYAFDAFFNGSVLSPSGIVGASTITPAPEPSSLAIITLMLIPAGAFLRRKITFQQ